MKKQLLLALGLVTAATAHADFNYQVDIGFGTQETDVDNALSNEERDNFDLVGRYYIQTVTNDNQPFREAAFISKSSFIELAYENSDVENNLLIDEEKDVSLTADIRIGETDFRVGGILANHDNGLITTTDLIAKFDWYVSGAENTLLSFEWGYGSGEVELSPVLEEDVSSNIWNVVVRDFRAINDEMSYVLGSYVNTDTTKVKLSTGSVETETREIALFGRLYLNQHLGLGALLEWQKVDNESSAVNPIKGSDAFSLGLDVSYDFNEMAGIGFELYTGSGTNEFSNIADQDFDTSGFDLTAQFRF